jgi:citrate lyase beta subunit
MRARRALLYMPGHDLHKIEKALTLDVDCICMDMEDSVAFNRKLEARQTIAGALGELDFGRSERLVRINPVGSGLEADDLETILPQHPEGIVLPKVESVGQLAWVSGRIEAAESEHGWPVNSIHLLAIAESARALLNLKEIAAHPRLEALIFGADDYAVSLGATRSRAGWEVLYSRSRVVMHAAAFNLQAVDMVLIDYRDTVSLKIEAAQGAQMGFSGKQIIHPDQVQPVQEAFTPSDQAIAEARRIVEAFEHHEAQGTGAFALDDRMIDMPTVKAAQGVLERAKAAGKI